MIGGDEDLHGSFLFDFLRTKDLSLSDKPAGGANAVRKPRTAAALALLDLGLGKVLVGTAVIAARPGFFLAWNRHIKPPKK
jgi:hypothetical protein